MVEKSLRDFLSSISPYLKVWGGVRVSGVAINLDGTWFNLAIRLTFVENEPQKKEIQSPEPNFLYYTVEFPVSAVQELTRQFVLDGKFELQTGDKDPNALTPIFLKRERQNSNNALPDPVQWSTPMIREAGLPGDTSGRKRTSISLDGHGQYVHEVLNYEMARKIEARLRNSDPPYDGLSGLFAHILPGVSYSGRSNTLLEIVAELPFELRTGERDSALVESPARTSDGSLVLRCFYGPGTGLPPSLAALQREDAETLSDGRLRWMHRPAWPEGAEKARIVLFFEQEQVQTLEVDCWPSAGNLRQLIDTYFDPSQEKLKSVLSDRGVMNQQEFEWAVTRLLNLLGLPAIWYGKGAAEARPDISGYVEGGPALLVECTLEKPLLKFSGLAERMKQLQAHLGAETDVLALVVTRSDTVDSEKQQAQEHGLALVGQTELREMLKMIDDGAGTKESLAYLEDLRTNVNIDLGASLNTRWVRPW